MHAKNSLVLAMAVVLAGCGGGDAGLPTSSTQPATSTIVSAPTERGTFRDAPVAGLRYESVSITGSRFRGVTDAGGGFLFHPGGSILFYYGSTELGRVVEGAGVISVADIARTEAEKNNIAVLLQSADTDKNPDNGLSMPSAAADASAAVLPLSFSSASPTSFNFQLAAAARVAGISSIVSSEAAAAHSERSDRLSLIQDSGLGKAITGKLTYPSNYNRSRLEASEKARVSLWAWQKTESLAFLAEAEIASGSSQAIDQQHVRVKRALNGIQAFLDVASAGLALGDLYKNMPANVPLLFSLSKVGATGWKIGTITEVCDSKPTDGKCFSSATTPVTGASAQLLSDIANDIGPDLLIEGTKLFSTGVGNLRIVAARIADPTFWAKKVVEVFKIERDFADSGKLLVNTKHANEILAAYTYLNAYYAAGMDDAATQQLLNKQLNRAIGSSYSDQVDSVIDYYYSPTKFNIPFSLYDVELFSVNTSFFYIPGEKPRKSEVERFILAGRSGVGNLVSNIESNIGPLSNELLKLGVLTADQSVPKSPSLIWNLTGNSTIPRCFAPSAQGSSDASGSALSYSWIVSKPNGTFSSFSGVEYTRSTTPFDSPGKYTVELTAQNAAGVSSQLRTVVLLPAAAPTDIGSSIGSSNSFSGTVGTGPSAGVVTTGNSLGLPNTGSPGIGGSGLGTGFSISTQSGTQVGGAIATGGTGIGVITSGGGGRPGGVVGSGTPIAPLAPGVTVGAAGIQVTSGGTATSSNLTIDDFCSFAQYSEYLRSR